MRIIGVLFTILGAAMAVRAQEQPALQGLPEWGVTLSGTPENPLVENHSGRVVIAYSMRLADANGQRILLPAQIMATSALPAGIPDGGAIYAQGMVPDPTRPAPRPRVWMGDQGPIVTATLRNVAFADGQFVGVDEQGAFELFGKKLKAITEVGMMAQNQEWNKIEALAQALAQTFTQTPTQTPREPPPSGEDPMLYLSHQQAALYLVRTRQLKGEAGADRLAEIYRSLPTLWK